MVEKKEYCKVLSASIVFFMVLSGLMIGTNLPEGTIPLKLSENVSGSFAGGDGSASNPYQISNITQLQDVQYYLDAHFILINDIDASSTRNWNDEEGFNPIGIHYQDPFKGSLEGQKYKITDLFINRPFEDHVGLLSYFTGSIRNVHLVNGNISGNSSVGGLMGQNYEGIVSNCSFSGIVNGTGNSVGGLIGGSYFYGTISDCKSQGAVRGNFYVGGLIGGHSYGSILNCYSTSDVVGSLSVGGLIGTCDEVVVSNCFTTGNVSGGTHTGGLVGHTKEGEVISCFASGMIAGSQSTGGLIGWNGDSYLSFSSAEGNVDCNGRKVGGLVGNNWGVISNCSSSGDVKGLGQDVGGLIGINVGVLTNCSSISEVSGSDMHVGGLVGYNGLSVSNCYSTGRVSGQKIVGGLLGHNHGVISNCYSTGDAKAISIVGGTGGLIGDNEGDVSNCYSTSNVSGGGYGGGLVGWNDYGVSNCYATGKVIGDYWAGGLVGRNDDRVSNCYSTGSVTGDGQIGGLVGQTDGTVSNSFWDIQTSGLSYSSGGAGITTDLMKNMETFKSVDWDFKTTWYMFEDNTYPLLKAFMDFYDDDPPFFGSDSTPKYGSTGDQFTFMISVSDNIGVSFVCVEYWFGNGWHRSREMAGPVIFTSTITIPSHSTSPLHYIIYAKDIVGILNETQLKNVIIKDNDKPLLKNDSTQNSGKTGGTFVFKLEVYDNIAIGEVWIEYWFGNGVHENITLSGMYPFNYSIIIPTDNIDDLNYIFHFNDTSGNWNQTGRKSIPITDSIPPILISDNSSQCCCTGKDFSIKVEISDNIGIGKVSVEYWYGEDEHSFIDLESQGNEYLGIIQVPVTTELILHYIVIAIDNSDLISEFDQVSLVIIDNIPPTIEPIENITINEGDMVNITAHASDNIGISSITWVGSPLIANGNVLEGVINDPGNYSIQVIVEDISGNQFNISFVLTVLPLDTDDDIDDDTDDDQPNDDDTDDDTTDNDTDGTEEKGMKTSKILIIVGAIVLILIVVLVIVFFIVKKKPDEEKDEQVEKGSTDVPDEIEEKVPVDLEQTENDAPDGYTSEPLYLDEQGSGPLMDNELDIPVEQTPLQDEVLPSEGIFYPEQPLQQESPQVEDDLDPASEFIARQE
jgi:hypothetical protein